MMLLTQIKSVLVVPLTIVAHLEQLRNQQYTVLSLIMKTRKLQ